MRRTHPRATRSVRPDTERGWSLQLTGPRRVSLLRTERCAPEPADVEIRLEGCGVCGSNAPVWEGRPWFEYPLAPGQPGHEGWGVIVRTGAEVRDLSVGQRVCFLSGHAFAEFENVPAAHCVELPQALDGRAFPGEPLACAVNVLRRSGIGPGHTVGIVGVGFLGALLTQLATSAGARVVAVSRRAFSLEVGAAAGAVAVVPLRNDDEAATINAVRDATDGALCDVVVEAAGLQSSLDVASALVRERGRLVVAGYHQDGMRQVDLQSWNWRGLDVINAHERDPRTYQEGMRLAVAAVCEGRMDPAPLLTHALPIERAGQAFEMLLDRPAGFLKAVVTP